MQTVRVFSSDIGMDFEIEKFAIMVMKRGKLDESEGRRLLDGSIIRSTGDDVESKVISFWGAGVRDIMDEELKRGMIRRRSTLRELRKLCPQSEMLVML